MGKVTQHIRDDLLVIPRMEAWLAVSVLICSYSHVGYAITVLQVNWSCFLQNFRQKAELVIAQCNHTEIQPCLSHTGCFLFRVKVA